MMIFTLFSLYLSISENQTYNIYIILKKLPESLNIF